MRPNHRLDLKRLVLRASSVSLVLMTLAGTASHATTIHSPAGTPPEAFANWSAGGPHSWADAHRAAKQAARLAKQCAKLLRKAGRNPAAFARYEAMCVTVAPNGPAVDQGASGNPGAQSDGSGSGANDSSMDESGSGPDVTGSDFDVDDESLNGESNDGGSTDHPQVFTPPLPPTIDNPPFFDTVPPPTGGPTFGPTTPTPPQSVPEPGTFALLGLGIAGLGLSRRRHAA